MDRFQFRRDTSARWTSINPILLEGEIGVETDTKLRKMGDGSNTWNNLDYLAAENITQESGDSETATISQKFLTQNTLMNRVPLTDTEDLNSYKDTGIYTWMNTRVPLNSPESAGGSLIIFSFFPSDAPLFYRCAQVCIMNNGNLYIRYKIQEGFTAWNKQATLENLSETAYNRIDISKDTDLNDLNHFGIYTWVNSNIPINSPVQSLGQLIVIPATLGSPTSRIFQYVVDYNGIHYFRYKASTGWSNWVHTPTREDILGYIREDTLAYRTTLVNGDDMNNLTHIGIYSWISSTQVTNAPFMGGGIVVVLPAFRTSVGELSRTAQLAMGPSGKMSFRYRTTSGWGNWIETTAKGGSSNGSPDENKISAFLSKCNILWEPLGNIPKNSETISYYPNKVNGLPYSSVFVFGNDIHYHRGLSAFYSAIKNPASIVYTKGYGGNTHRGSYYGTVCSSFTCYLCGQKIYYETSEMLEILNKIEYIDVEQLMAGDVLITAGHCKVISGIIKDESNDYTIYIAEQGGNSMNERAYNQADFEKFLKGEDSSDPRVYQIGRFPNQYIRVLPKVEYSENIISEYGDRTYFNVGEDIFIYVKNGDSINIIDGSTVISDINLNDLPKKVVNGTILYNVKSILSHTGSYQLYSSGDTIYANLEVVDTGNAVLSGNTVTISNYSDNIKPSWWSVIMLVKEETDFPYYPAPEGYVGHQAYLCKGEIDANTFNVELKDFVLNSDGYYVRCYYETKFGLSYKDSNIIMLK